MTKYSVSVDCSCEGSFFVLHFGVMSPAYDLCVTRQYVPTNGNEVVRREEKESGVNLH